MNSVASSNKKIAGIVGILILTAYGVLVSAATNSKPIVMLFDIISGLSVIGIAVLMFPLFNKFSKNLSLSYLLLKIIEGTLMVAAGLLFLYSSLQFLRDWIYNGIHLYVFIISGFLFYYLLSISNLVPRFISIWGGVAIFALFSKTVLKLVGLSYPILDILLILIITNEVFLAIWLMIKGFKPIK